MSPLRKAFFAGACLGVLTIVFVKLFHVLSPALLLLLCPGCALSNLYQGSHPFTAGVLVGILEFALNFGSYGLMGLAIGYVVMSGGSGRTRN